MQQTGFFFSFTGFEGTDPFGGFSLGENPSPWPSTPCWESSYCDWRFWARFTTLATGVPVIKKITLFTRHSGSYFTRTDATQKIAVSMIFTGLMLQIKVKLN